MDGNNPKSALVDAIKKSTNILVTVSHNPSVDALAAALGFSLMLNKMDKHATAVFSGAIPPAISFLEPEKNFEGTVSSLRDFIIALDKEKADRLRYKVEGDVVRIYITPYKTTLTQNDLEFSEGDFNVDLVIALGVEKQSDLDNAISAHGRILHDATVATVNLTNTKSSVGTIDWSDDKASSLCEMLMSLSEALQGNLLDEQISTALLTGIVAATDRFSNQHTTPRVMTMSAQLMAAGANQQLIAEKLQNAGELPRTATDGTVSLKEDTSTKVDQSAELPPVAPTEDGSMQVRHDDAKLDQATQQAEDLATAATEDRKEAANAKLEAALGHGSSQEDSPGEVTQIKSGTPSTDWRDHVHEATVEDEPLMGGTLSATTSEAEAVKRAEERSARNHTILSHDSMPLVVDESVATFDSQANKLSDVDSPADTSQLAVSQPHLEGLGSTKGRTLQPVTMQPIKASDNNDTQQSSPAFTPFPEVPSNDTGLTYEESPLPTTPAPSQDQTLADLEAEVHAAALGSPATSSIDDARAAVTNAFGAQPLSVGGQPTPLQPVIPAASTSSPFAPPPLPPMPDFSTLPPLPAQPGVAPQQPTTPPAAPAPGQFQIPGQQ